MIAQFGSNEWPALRRGYAAYWTRDPQYHAMIVAETRASSDQGLLVKVFHMGPPMASEGTGGHPHKLTERSWIGWIPDWDASGHDRVCAEISMVEQKIPPTPAGRNRWHHYDLGAHGVEEFDANDPGEAVVTRCSCASLVEHCYEMAGRDLVNEEHVPELTMLDELIDVLARNRDARVKELIRQKFLEFEEEAGRPIAKWPCRVLLPAYQMRAFQEESYPRKPSMTDHPFP